MFETNAPEQDGLTAQTLMGWACKQGQRWSLNLKTEQQ